LAGANRGVTGALTEYNSLDHKDGFADFLIAHQEVPVPIIDRTYMPLFDPARDMPRWLLRLSQVRGVGIYFAQVNRRDRMGRIQKLLERREIYSEILHQNTCKPDERENWYRRFVRCSQLALDPGSTGARGVPLP
jgi:hypothetical protein